MSEYYLAPFESDVHQNTLASILNVPLAPERLYTYASDALAQVIGLIDTVVGSYTARTFNLYDNRRSLEDDALAAHGLKDIGDILGHLSLMDEKIRTLHEFVASLEPSTTITVPPQTGRSTIQPGRGAYEAPGRTPKLETTLLVLSELFGVDVLNDDEIVVTPGSVTDEMIRRSSYVTVDAIKLNRVILVCDEMENITYVFDRTVLEEQGIPVQALETKPKSELNDLIAKNGNVGSRLSYSPHFTENIVELITDPGAGEPKLQRKREPGEIRLLRPKAPEGYLSVNGLTRALGFKNPNPVHEAIEALGEELGPLDQLLFRGVETDGISPTQQLIITSYLEARGKLRPKAPAGIWSNADLAKEFDMYPGTLRGLIRDISAELGEVESYRFGGNTAPGYKDIQKAIIQAEVERRKELWRMFTTYSALKSELGVGNRTLKKAIATLGIEPIELPAFMKTGKATTGFDREQKDRIKAYLDEHYFSIPEATEETARATDIAKQCGVLHATVTRAIEELGDKLGEVKEYRFPDGRTDDGLKAAQQALVISALEAKKLQVPKTPQGYLPETQIGNPQKAKQAL